MTLNLPRDLTVLSILFALSTPASAQTGDHSADEHTFHGDTEVIGSRVAPEASAAGRRQVVVNREEIEALPVQSVHELLAALPGIGLARRGARGVQGDLNLRGSTFEQSVVMVNGVRVSNPQTGHHNLDLFIPLEVIERVEVLYGPGSAVHGPDVFGGAINIVTGISTPVVGHFRIGENNLTGGAVGGAYKGFWGAAEREVHTGFRDNTEADVNQAAAGYSWSGNGARFDITTVAGRRRFGAHAFYSSRFPDEWESTSGRLAVVSGEAPLGKRVRLTGALRTDWHEDDFILDRHRPEWFHNHHETRSQLLELELRGVAGPWQWVAGVELSRDTIDSSNLGNHDRDRQAVFAELGRFDGPLSFSLQVRTDHQDSWGTEPTFAAGGRWRFHRNLALRAAAGTSIRAPSFTDLYYQSPSTEGNPLLEPEQGRSFEIGLESTNASLTAFRREADPIIDYLLDDDGVWRATNLGRVTTTGIEASFTLPEVHRFVWQRIGATWLDSTASIDPSRSAYALRHPRLEAAWTGGWQPTNLWRSGWSLRFRDPVDQGSWTTLDLRLGRRMLPTLWLDLEANNMLDRNISELHGVPLPGRWVTLTASWQCGGSS